MSLRPFYLPCEFHQLFIVVAYIHRKAHSPSACKTVSEVVHKLQCVCPDAPMSMLGDFNHVSLKKTLPNMYQYVTCSTTRDKTLDLCYGSVKDAYKSLPLPAMGCVVNNCVYLLPIYKTVLKREMITLKEIKTWTEDSVLCLQGCYECTDWDVFIDACILPRYDYTMQESQKSSI